MRGWGGCRRAGVALWAALSVPVLAAPSPLLEDKLTEFDFLLLGLTVRPEPEAQVVPRNTATGIRVELAFSDLSADAAGLLSLLPAGIEVAAELVGPGIGAPIELRAPPGALLPIPPLVQKGVYLVRDIRLLKNGEVFLRASPDSATVEVIERVLITEVTTRPLTLEEIRQRGILFGDDSFTGYNFTLALRLDSRPVTIDFPVVFDSNEIPIPTRPSAGLSLQGSTVPINAGFVPVMMRPELPPEMDDEAVLTLLSDVRIPGLIVIPGDVGFLNQFFSAILLVSNGAPSGSLLSVRDLDAEITLPFGDALAIAATETGGLLSVLPIRGLGSDGAPGTADDTDAFAPGEQGQAEFLLEGRKEGFHEIRFDIEGTLDGLPIGPIPLTGVARGGVLVRNPTFNLTFTAPATVRTGEEFSLFIGVTNVSSSIANLVAVRLDPTQISGATLLSGPSEPIPTLLAGDTEVLEFRFVSNTTGQVTASYLNVEEGTGDLLFRLGVGERGVPLSPDTLVLPKSVEALPAGVVRAALRVLGQAWSVATAPNGTLPDGVSRVPRQVVLDRATEVAEAGFRVQLGEPSTVALESLALSWTREADPGFEQVVRQTSAGKDLFARLGASFGASGSILDFQRSLSLDLSGFASNVLVGVGSESGEAPLDWTLSDASGRALAPGSMGSLPNAVFLPLTEPASPGRALALVARPASSLYEWSFTSNAASASSLDLAVSLPRQDGSVGFHRFDSVEIGPGDEGRLMVDLLQTNPILALRIDRDGDGIFEDSIVESFSEVLATPPPSLLAATVIGPETLTGADPWGRVVALLFDREMREAEVRDTSSFEVEENAVLSSSLQLSRRIAFVFAESPVSDFVERTVEVRGLFDANGRPLPPSTETLSSRLVDAGAVVSGRVLNADGTPVPNAEVLYVNAVPNNVIGISRKVVDAFGRYQFDYVRKSPDGGFFMRASDPATGAVQQLSTSVGFDGERIVVDLVLLGRGGVSGVVRDSQGSPVSNAKVLVTSEVDPSSFFLTETDGEGRYVATGIVVGPLSVRAVAGTSSGLGSGNLRRAGTFTTVDVSLNLTVGTVTGGVYELAQDIQTPIEGIQVYYVIPDGLRDLVAATARTDASGQYGFVDIPIPAGDFKLVAVDPVRGRRTSLNGTFPPGQAVLSGQDVFFIADEYGAIEATILDAAGATVAEGQALVTSAGRQLLTDASGKVRFSDLPAGLYTVTAQGIGSSRSVGSSVTVLAHATASVSLRLPGTGRVVVSVLDETGALLSDQPVLRTTSGPCAGVQVLTGSSGGSLGVAVFEDVPLGGVVVKSLRGSDVAVATTTIQKDGDERAVVLRFSGFGTLTGTVVDPNDDPFLGANVVLASKRLESSFCLLVPDKAAQQVKTGLDGRFTFKNVPLGEFTVSASEPTFFDVPVSAKGVLLEHGGTVNVPLKLVSTIAGRISGTVYLPDGETPAGAGVRLTVSSPARPDVSVPSDSEGRYGFAPVFPQGLYTLTAADPATGNAVRERVALLPGQDLAKDLRLLGRSDVEVTVLKSDGTLAEEAFVELKGTEFPFDGAAGNVGPFDSGRVVFPRISEGRFTVTANDGFGRGGRASGRVTSDGVPVAVTVTLSVTGRVHGTFVAANGVDPIPNATVLLRQGSTGRLLGSSVTSSMAGEVGTFSFEYVPAGPVLATATDPLTGRIGEAAAVIEQEGQDVALGIRALGLGTISGTVTSGGAGLAGADVELTSSTGLSSAVSNLRATATSGEGGAFVFDGVPVGSFTVKATLPGGSPLTGTATGNLVEDGQRIEDLEVPLEPSGAIVGEVLRPDGAQVVAGAALELRPVKGIFRAQSSSTGGYRFDFVPAGDFTLEAEEPTGPDAGIASGTLAEGEELLVDVVFNGTGTIQGTALDSNGGFLSSGRVRLTRPSPFARDETKTVSTDGTFTFLGVPVGGYTLSLGVDGSPLRGTATGAIELDGDVDEPVIQLAPATSVEGTVVKPEGSGGTLAAENVVVTLSGSGVFFSTLSRSDGRFTLPGVPEGTFSVKAQDPLTGGIVSATAIVDLPEAPPFAPVDLGTLLLDLEPIRVLSVTPAEGASLVPPDSSVVLTFSDPFSSSQVSGRFFVRSGGVQIGGTPTVSADGLTLTFDPSSFLPPSSVVDVFLSKDLTDTLGRKLGTDFTSSFATGGAVVEGRITHIGAPVAGAEVTLTAGALSTSALTGADGRFRFQDVAPGTISIVATEGGLTGSRVTDVGSEVGVVDVGDVPLQLVASVSGRVFEFDGSASGAGIEIRISQNGTPVGFTTTSADGSYAVANVPLGAFLLDATNPANGDRGRRTDGNLSTGGLSSFDVAMNGVGDVRVLAEDGTEQRLGGVQVTVSRTLFGATTVRNGVTDASGEVVFTGILAGAISVTGVDPATSTSASVSATAAAGVETVVILVLESSGAIEGTVTAPGGASPFAGAQVRIYRESGSLLRGEAATAADGSYSVGDLPPSQSPYRADVLVNGTLRARRRGIEVPAGGAATVDVELSGVGVVSGTVLPPSGETLSSSITVTLTSLAPDIGGIRTTTTSEALGGGYSFTDVPVGPFRVTARDNLKGFLGASEGVVSAHGETVTVEVQLLDNAFTFPASGQVLDDGNGTRYRIGQTGAMMEGVDSIFDFFTHGLLLDVTVGGSTTRFTGDPLGTREESDRELVTAVEPIGDLNVRRKMYVPPDGYFARYLEIFENSGAEPIDLIAELVSNLNGTASLRPGVVDSFNGDDLVGPGETWLVLDDPNDADPHLASVTSIPATAFILAGSTSSGPGSVDFGEVGNDGLLTVGYEVSIPPGGRAVLMHFLSQQLSRAAAREAAERLAELPPEALRGLEADEIAAISTFAVPSDGVSATPPLPPLDGRVSGAILAADGVTRVGDATGVPTLAVELQSDHLLYRRVRTQNAGSGAFRFAGDPEASFVIPRVGFTLKTSSSLFGETVPVVVASDFTGPTLMHDAPDVSRSASSELGSSNTVDKAFDRIDSTYWTPTAADAAPSLELLSPVPVRVIEVDLLPHASASLSDVEVALFDEQGGLVESQTAVFPAGNEPAVLSFVSPEPAVRVRLRFTGSTVRVAELSVLGEAETGIGHALRDLRFFGTASVDVNVTEFDGTPAWSTLTFTASGFSRLTATDTGGHLFFAPVPAGATPLTVLGKPVATAQRFLSASEVVNLVADETSFLTLVMPQAATLSGTVFDGDGSPVAFESVTLLADTGPGAGQSLSTTTSASGAFGFSDLPSGSYRLRVIPNASTLFVPVTVNAPTPVVQDVHLPVFGSVGVTVQFEPGGPSNPAGGALVNLTDSLGRAHLSKTTNASGGIPTPFTDVPAGPFTLSVRHPTNFSSTTVDSSHAITMAGETVQALVVIPAFADVTANVRLGDGTTSAVSSRVSLAGPDLSFPDRFTNSAGATTFSNVRGFRPFTLTAAHPAANRGHIVTQGAGEILAQGASVSIGLTLPKTATVEVTVEEEGGAGILGASVSIRDSFSTEFRPEGTTSSNGKRTIAVVPEGAFTVRAEMGGALLGEASGVVTAHGETVSVTITRPADATVEGTVFAGDGETPVEGAPVTLLDEGETEVLDSTVTDAEGAFRFEGVVAPGTSAVVSANFPFDQSLRAETTVTASSPGETLTVNLDLPVTVVKGRVLEFDGLTEVSGATVTVHPVGTGEAYDATVTPDGSFVLFERPEGLYEIVAEDSSGLVGRAQGELIDFSLERDVLLPEHGTVEGTVTDAGGSPLSGAPVHLWNANALSRRSVFPDASGFFRFERVAFGSFGLVYDGVPVPAQGAGALSSLETLAVVNLAAPETGTVFGEVRDGSGVVLPPNEDTFVILEARGRETSDGVFQAFPAVLFDTVSFSESGAPVGEVSAVSQDYNLLQAGIATGTLTSSGPLELNPEMGTAPLFPYPLEPGALETNEVDGDGVLYGSFDNMTEGVVSFGRMEVNRKPAAYLSGGTFELSGRQVVLGPSRVAGVEHTRKVYVPEGAPYARIVDELSNPNGFDMQVTVSWESSLSIPAEVTAFSGSWVAGENGDGTAVALVYAGAGGMRRTPDATVPRLVEEWRSVVVPAGGRVVLLHFAIQAPDLATAVSLAGSLSSAPDLTGLSFEIEDVVNFEIP